MRTHRYIHYLVMILILAMSVSGCSSISKQVKKVTQPKKKVEKPVTPKPAKPKALPTSIPPVKPKDTPTPIPKVTPKPAAKPEPEPTPTPKPEPPQPNVQIIIQNGVAYQEAGDIKKAIALFEQALKLDPGNANAAQYLKEAQTQREGLITFHFNKGIAFFNQDALEDAIREWDKVLDLDPDHQEALKNKAKAQKRLDALKNQ